jgi:hypothetical protein
MIQFVGTFSMQKAQIFWAFSELEALMALAKIGR